MRGKSFSIIEAVHLGSEAEARELLAPLRELGAVLMDTFADVPPSALQHLHMDPIEPVPYDGTHALLGEFTERAIDEALAAVGPGAGSPVSFEVRHLGGALSRSEASHGAIDTMRGEYMMFGVAPIIDPAMAPAMAADLARLAEAFAPDDSGRYLNFTEVAHAVEDMFPDGHRAAAARRQGRVRPGGLVQSKSRGLVPQRADSVLAPRDRVPLSESRGSCPRRPLRFR